MAVKQHFLDSGAFGFKRLSLIYQEKHRCGRWDYYKTKTFRKILDKYGKFVRKYKIALDYYANLDVIGNAKLTWHNQRYLEDNYEIQPVPVIHMGCNQSLLKFYIDKGYRYIAFGGFDGKIADQIKWISAMFSYLSGTEDKKPKVKIHGFGVGDFKRMSKFPWHSVDSTNWFRIGSFGCVLVPEIIDGNNYNFNTAPNKILISKDSPFRSQKKGKDYRTKTRKEKEELCKWFSHIGIKIGDDNTNGLTNWYAERTKANMLYYYELAKHFRLKDIHDFHTDQGFFF